MSVLITTLVLFWKTVRYTLVFKKHANFLLKWFSICKTFGKEKPDKSYLIYVCSFFPGSYEALLSSHKAWSLSRKLVFQPWNTLGVSNDSLLRTTEPSSILRRRNLKTGVSHWKRVKCLRSHDAGLNLKSQQLLFRKEITLLSWCFRFQKAPFSKCFSSTLKRKASVFKFLRFEERFRKAPFSWRISVDGRPNRGNTAAFSNYSGEVWTRPE